MFKFFAMGIVLGLLACGVMALTGCQASVSGAVYYPKSWKSAGDPADSRLGSQGINYRKLGESR